VLCCEALEAARGIKGRCLGARRLGRRGEARLGMMVNDSRGGGQASHPDGLK
jgi:hypothetical protein